MENLDFDVLKQLERLKVGEMQKAIEGVDPMVRLMDVPAVVALLNSDRLRQQERDRATSVPLAKMSALFRALALTFSQDASRRNLELATVLSAQAADLGKAASVLIKEGDVDVQVPTGTFEELLDQAISHAAFCESFSLAADLQRLGEAVVGGAEDLAEWTTIFEDKRARAKRVAVSSAEPALRRPRRGRRAAADHGATLAH